MSDAKIIFAGTLAIRIDRILAIAKYSDSQYEIIVNGDPNPHLEYYINNDEYSDLVGNLIMWNIGIGTSSVKKDAKQ